MGVTSRAAPRATQQPCKEPVGREWVERGQGSGLCVARQTPAHPRWWGQWQAEELQVLTRSVGTSQSALALGARRGGRQGRGCVCLPCSVTMGPSLLV